MSVVNMEPDQWQLGKSKVFVKSPESVSSGLCRFVGVDLWVWFFMVGVAWWCSVLPRPFKGSGLICIIPFLVVKDVIKPQALL